MARILIIDDDADLVQILTLALKSSHHEVAYATNPADGLTVSRRFHPDLILLDYHMPGETGAHLFESFRRNNSTADTPILFLSGEASPEQVLSEIVDAGKSRFMTKPIHIAELQKTIQEMLRI